MPSVIQGSDNEQDENVRHVFCTCRASASVCAFTPVQTVERSSSKVHQQLPGSQLADYEDLTDLAAGAG